MSSDPCTVGLTGGLASGKSTVATILESLGASIFDCDDHVHKLYRPGGAGAKDVAYLFGDGVLDADGGVDRAALADRVLDRPSARERLESAIHPLVRTGVDEWLSGLPRQSVAVVEAALLVETGFWRRYDLLAVVWCEAAQQVERAIARGVPADLAQRLLKAQLPIAEKRALADIDIDNSGRPDELDGEVRRAWTEMLEHCRQRRR